MAWSKAKQMKFLSDAPVIRVATVNRSCKPQVTPVCHVVWKGNLCWASDLESVKVAHLARRRWVALVADVYQAHWRNMGGVMVQGPAKAIRSGQIFLAVRSLLYKKFKAYQSNAGFEQGEAAIIEATRQRRFSWWFR